MKGKMMKELLKFLILSFLVSLIQFIPQPAMACVEGLSWGMRTSILESHLGVALKSIQESEGGDVFEVRNFQISGLPVKSLRLLVEEEDGLKQIAYEIDYENMTEVLAGLRHRFGPPVGTSDDFDGRSTQQKWIWHTGEDLITAVKTEERKFILFYRPSLLDPSFL